MRLRALIAYIALVTLALFCIKPREQNAGLPVVHTAAPAQSMMLFSPCPLKQRNFPVRRKDDA